MNNLLASLPDDDYQRVSSELTWRQLKVRQILHKHGEPLVAEEPAAVMSVEAFRREMDRRGAFYDRVTRYSQAFVNMLMQSVACNGSHSAEE